MTLHHYEDRFELQPSPEKKSDKKRRGLYLIIAAGTQQEAVANKTWSAEFFIRSFKGWENNVQEYRFYSLNAIKSNNAWEL